MIKINDINKRGYADGNKIEIKFDAHVFHVVFQHGSFIGYSNSQKLFIYDYRGGKYERSL